MTTKLDKNEAGVPPENSEDYFVACPAQQEVLVRFSANRELEIRQQDALGNEHSVIHVGEDNIRAFLGCIVRQYRHAHGKHAASDLAGYLCDVAGVPSTRDIDYGDPLAPVAQASPSSRPKDPTARERMRRYRERKRSSETEPVTQRNAAGDDRNQDRNGGQVGRNAVPLQPELLSN